MAHPLQTPWAFYYYNSGGGGRHDYASCIKKISKVFTAEEFWAVYAHLLRPERLRPTESIHFFRGDSRAMWEDPENVNGGMFHVQFQPGHVDGAWEKLLLDFVGEALDPDLFGATVVHRKELDRMQIWNRAGDDPAQLLLQAGQLFTSLELPFKTQIEFKAHQGGKGPIKAYKIVYEADGAMLVP
jgi:translation initiation factor 4E